MRASNPSVALTDGIRVTVTSRYLPEQSIPQSQRFVWAYTVRITNEGARSARLETRHWVITDSAGNVDEVRGPGVVGEQPNLRPGETFQYTSGCILKTPSGTMHGTYQMVRDDARFDAAIAPFTLTMPITLN